MSRLMTKTAFARSQGFSNAYLSALIRKGVVIPVGDKIDYDQARAALEANRAPRLQKRKRMPQEVDLDEAEDDALTTLPAPSSRVSRATELSTILLETRIRNEVEKGKLLAVEARVKTGQYVDAEQVNKEAFQAARATRDALLNIPGRVSHLLASVSEADPIYEILTQEIRTALEGLAGRLEAVAEEELEWAEEEDDLEGLSDSPGDA